MDKKQAAKLRKSELVAWRIWHAAILSENPDQATIDAARIAYETARTDSESARREYPFIFPPRR